MTNILKDIASTFLEGPLEPKSGCPGYYMVDKDGEIPSFERRSTWKCPVCMAGTTAQRYKQVYEPSRWSVVYHKACFG